MKNKSKVRFSLGKKAGLLIVLMMSVLGGCTLFLSYTAYKQVMDEEYEINGRHIINAALSQITVDELKHYLDTKEIDEAYTAYQQYLADLREAHEVSYVYILHLGEVHGTYIFGSDMENVMLGYEEPFDKTYQELADQFAEGEEVDHLVTTGEWGWLMTVMQPVLDEDGNQVAYACVDIPMNRVVQQRRDFLLMLGNSVVVVTILCCVIGLLQTRKRIIIPINQLADATGEFVQADGGSPDAQGGDASVPAEAGMGVVKAVMLNEESSTIQSLDIRTGDEIEHLCQSIKKMEQDIYHYIHNLMDVTAEKERIGAELNVATQIQASMLPCIFPAFPDCPGFDIYATMQPAKEVGGDFYDFFLVDKDHLAFVMADVSGKGVPAALFMVIAKTLIKKHAQGGSEPGKAFETANNQLCENNEAGMFVTAWMGIMEISTGKCVSVNAGHNPPVLYRKGGEFEYMESPSNLVLAAVDGIEYEQAEFQLAPGDTLYLYTDGVTEATDVKDELYGEERLQEVLNRNRGLDPDKLLQKVKEDMDAFVKEMPQFDDITMLALKIQEREI